MGGQAKGSTVMKREALVIHVHLQSREDVLAFERLFSEPVKTSTHTLLVERGAAHDNRRWIKLIAVAARHSGSPRSR